jgi:sugar lactone lactonase YvrE
VPSADQFTEVCTVHGEGAVWSSLWGGLKVLDMLAGDVLTVHMDGSVARQHLGNVAACVRPRTAGGMVAALERGFALVDPDGSIRVLPDVWHDPDVRMNDGCCDPDGRFWCGSMAYDVATGGGALFRLDPDGAVTRVLDGVTISNGLGFSPDGGRAYYADTPTQEVSVFDYDPERGLTGRRPLVRIPEELGAPDGLTVDAQGYVWVALWKGGAVHRYSPQGRLDGVVDVPARLTTSCTLGGPELMDLYVTTSREGLGDLAEAGAGAVFKLRVDVAGQEPLAFAG